MSGSGTRPSFASFERRRKRLEQCCFFGVGREEARRWGVPNEPATIGLCAQGTF